MKNLQSGIERMLMILLAPAKVAFTSPALTTNILSSIVLAAAYKGRTIVM
jgi:hypothetical protein